MKRVQKGHVSLKWYVAHVVVFALLTLSPDLSLVLNLQLGSRWSTTIPNHVGAVLSLCLGHSLCD